MECVEFDKKCLSNNIKDVTAQCLSHQKPEPIDVLIELGICVPWKDTFFVNWKTEESHLGMDFAKRISNANYEQLLTMAEKIYELARSEKEFEPEDWDFASKDYDPTEDEDVLDRISWSVHKDL